MLFLDLYYLIVKFREPFLKSIKLTCTLLQAQKYLRPINVLICIPHRNVSKILSVSDRSPQKGLYSLYVCKVNIYLNIIFLFE